jgi:uncharacterized protein (TIGR02246 family)
MKFKLVLAAVIAAAAIGSVSGQSKQAAALRSLVQKMADAQANYDPKTLDEVFASDYVEVSPVGEVDDRAKVIGFYKPESKPPADKMSLTIAAKDFSIRDYGKYAIVIVRFEYLIVSGGKPSPPRSIRSTIVCRKEKDVWKIASAQYTGIR